MRLTMPWTAGEVHHNGVSSAMEDVRQQLGREVDHLAHVAAQLGRDIGQQAKSATAARDTSKDAGTRARQLLEGATALGPAIAFMGRRRMRELRQVRLTTEPKQTRRNSRPGLALVAGLAIGVEVGLALMYFLDPDRGRRRRVLLGGQLAKWTRIGRQTATERAKLFTSRTVGVMAEARRPLEPAEAETTTFEPLAASSGYGSTQTPEAPERGERRTTTAVG